MQHKSGASLSDIFTDITQELEPDWVIHPDISTNPPDVAANNDNPLKIVIGADDLLEWTLDDYKETYDISARIAENYGISVRRHKDQPENGYQYTFCLHSTYFDELVGR